MVFVVSQNPKNLDTLIKNVRIGLDRLGCQGWRVAVLHAAGLVLCCYPITTGKRLTVYPLCRVVQRDYVSFPKKAEQAPSADEIYERVTQERARRSAR